MKSTDKIAMKITEEEYNNILPILKENGLVEGDVNEWAKDWCYLVNIRNIGFKGINLYINVNGYTSLSYNKELFLQYCGINMEETLQEYIKRVNSTLYSSFLAEKELKNRKPIFKTEDGVDIFEGDIIDWVINNKEDVRFLYQLEFNKQHAIMLNRIDTVFKVFSTKEKAEEWVSNNTPQKTVDGFEITRGEEMWVVSTNFYKLHKSVGGHFKKDNGKHLLFKNKENAINYIVLNKVTLFLSDIDFLGFGEERMSLIKKVKETLGF